MHVQWKHRKFSDPGKCPELLYRCSVCPAVAARCGCDYSPHCAGFGWANYLYSSWCEAMFWICARNSVDNPGMFESLLSNTDTAFSAPHPTPPVKRMGMYRIGREYRQDCWPQLTKEHSIPHGVMLRTQSYGEEEEREDIGKDGACLPKSLLCMMEPLFPGDRWRWEVFMPDHGKCWMNSFLCFTCMWRFCFPH